MRKLAAFFYILRKSVFAVSYYQEIINAPLRFSLKYYLSFSLLLGCLLTIGLSVIIVPPLRNFSARLKTRAFDLYPLDLVLTVKNGELSTNTAEPIHFPLPYELFTDTPPAVTDQAQQYLLTIDTSGSPNDFPDSRSVVLLTKFAIVVGEGMVSERYSVYPLKELADLRLDKVQFDRMVSTMMPILDVLPAIVIAVLSVMLIFFLPISRLLFLAVLSVLLIPAARLLNLTLSYKKLFQLGLHALTLPTLIQIVMYASGLIPPLPFFTSTLFYLFMLVVFAELRKKPTAGI